jgi:hypothetical protein
VREVDGGIRPFADGVKKRLVKQRYVSARHVQEKRALSLHLTRDCMRHVAGLLDDLIGQQEQGGVHRDP